MAQGRKALLDLLNGVAGWPPVVVPFGLDPWGWHGQRESYRRVCDFAMENCTLLPKVFPVTDPLSMGAGEYRVVSEVRQEPDGTLVRRHQLMGVDPVLSSDEIQTPGDSSWKIRKRWIEDERDFETFLGVSAARPPEPDVEALRTKEREVGERGLPYAEINDPFSVVAHLFDTETFYVKTYDDTERLLVLLSRTQERVVHAIEVLCEKAACPFILRLIGAEIAVPPFMSRQSFMRFSGDFYRRAAAIAHRSGVPVAFHCHGPVRGIMADVWQMGCDLIEPFEPSPRGNVSIAEALRAAPPKGVVFGGVDDTLLQTASADEVRAAVQRCLDDARDTGRPFMLSQTATPFFEPLGQRAEENLLLFMRLGIED
jgi:hypothetical protein